MSKVENMVGDASNSEKDIDYESISFGSRDEVVAFEKMLHEYTSIQTNGFAMNHISLARVFDLCQQRSDGRKILIAVIDIQINLAMLACDNFVVGSLWNRHFVSSRTPQVASILDSQEVFNAKLEIHRHTTSFIFRYRALWDKIMGVLVLVIVPAQYERYDGASKKKATFRKIMEEGNVIVGLGDAVWTMLQRFDDKYRTPEAHGNGSVRKFSLTMQRLETSPFMELMDYWNRINGFVANIGDMINEAGDKIQRPQT